MIRFKMLSILLILGALASCKTDVKTPAEDNQTPINEEQVVAADADPKASVGTKTEGLACDEGYELNIHWTENPKIDSITVDIVKDGKSQNVPMLEKHSKHFAAANGFELKGAEGTYALAQDGKLICNCKSK